MCVKVRKVCPAQAFIGTLQRFNSVMLLITFIAFDPGITIIAIVSVHLWNFWTFLEGHLIAIAFESTDTIRLVCYCMKVRVI